MMDNLWRLSFTPRHPVCKGELIIVTGPRIKEDEAKRLGLQILASYGILDGEVTIAYLGEFMGSCEFYKNAERPIDKVLIVTIQTGDY